MRIVRAFVLIGVGIAASLAAFGQEKPRPASPAFGTTTMVYQRLSPMDFNKLSSGPGGSGEASFVTSYFPELAGYSMTIYPSAPSFFNTSHLFASPHLPGGALLKYVELDYCDTNTGSNRVHLEVRDCTYTGDCSAGPISSFASGANGCSHVEDQNLSYTVNNFTRQILIDVSFDATDGTNALAGVIVGYVLQVSPAGAQVFGDVPPSDLAFQFINALVASGITAGCGGGNYCPDSPLTRRQMAVFLAKALGLNWSQ